jgi:alpha-beta hydrolase superfamily lysophospholipase
MRLGRLGVLLGFGALLMACAGEALVASAGDVVPRRAWLPGSEPRAVILALHGFNDYGNAFAELGSYASAQGVAVHTYDQRGFGANTDAGRWPGIEALTAGLRQEGERLAALYPGRPLFLLGESMGAAVVIAAVAEDVPPASGIILSAPAVWGDDQLNPFYRATLWLAARVVPGLHVTGAGLDIMASDNIDMLRALGADPLVIKETRIDALAGLVGLMDRGLLEANALPGPLLVLGGVRDEVVPPEAHLAMVAKLQARACTTVDYPEGYHMLLRDHQRQVVFADLLAWIEDRPLPSGLARACGGSLSPVVAVTR